MADPLSVACPDCLVPAEEDCAGHYGTHAARQRLADLRSLDHGTCALCGRPMVKGTVEGGPVDAWHYQPEDAAACPPMPDPLADWNRYATAINLGLSPGHPGMEHFTPTPVLPLDPEPEGEAWYETPGDVTYPDPAPEDLPEHDLPGTWSRSDFTGGIEEHRGEGRHCEDPHIAEAHPPHGWSPAGDPTRWRYWCSGAEVRGPDWTPPPSCPECRNGKHVNCTGQAWDDAADAPVLCGCPARGAVGHA